MADLKEPLILGIGGTTVAGSSTERALAIALQGAAAAGVRTRMFDGAFLARLPLYTPYLEDRNCGRTGVCGGGAGGFRA